MFINIFFKVFCEFRIFEFEFVKPFAIKDTVASSDITKKNKKLLNIASKNV